MKSVITHIYIYLFLYRLHIMSGSCKHQKRCGLLLLRLLYIFLNKKKIIKKKKINKFLGGLSVGTTTSLSSDLLMFCLSVLFCGSKFNRLNMPSIWAQTVANLFHCHCHCHCHYILFYVCFHGITFSVHAVVDACFTFFHLLHHLGITLFHLLHHLGFTLFHLLHHLGFTLFHLLHHLGDLMFDAVHISHGSGNSHRIPLSGKQNTDTDRDGSERVTDTIYDGLVTSICYLSVCCPRQQHLIQVAHVCGLTVCCIEPLYVMRHCVLTHSLVIATNVRV